MYYIILGTDSEYCLEFFSLFYRKNKKYDGFSSSDHGEHSEHDSCDDDDGDTTLKLDHRVVAELEKSKQTKSQLKKQKRIGLVSTYCVCYIVKCML